LAGLIKTGLDGKFALFHLGGYVKFFGDSNAASKPSKSSEVNSKGPPQNY